MSLTTPMINDCSGVASVKFGVGDYGGRGGGRLQPALGYVRSSLVNKLPFLVAAQSLAKVVGFHLLSWADDVWEGVEKPPAEAHTESFEWVGRRGKVAEFCHEELWMLTPELSLDSVGVEAIGLGSEDGKNMVSSDVVHLTVVCLVNCSSPGRTLPPPA